MCWMTWRAISGRPWSLGDVQAGVVEALLETWEPLFGGGDGGGGRGLYSSTSQLNLSRF